MIQRVGDPPGVDIFLSFLNDFVKDGTMPSTCSVGGCVRNSIKSPGVSFFKFPRDPATCSGWVKFVNNTRENFTLTKWSLICSAHFTDNCRESTSKLMKSLGIGTHYRLRPNIVPTLEAPNIVALSRARKNTTASASRPSSAGEGEAPMPTTSAAKTTKRASKHRLTGSAKHTGADGRKKNRRNSNEANGHQTEQDALPSCSSETNSGQPPEVTEGEQFWKDYHQTKAEAMLYRKACKTLQLLSLPNIKDDDRAFERYTGLPNYAVFEVLHDYLKPNSKCSGEKSARDTLPNSVIRTLTSQEEFFMFLVAIKTGNLASDMALRFGITKPTFNVIFASWAVFVSNMLDDFGKTVMKPHASNVEELETFIVIDCTPLLHAQKASQPDGDCPQKRRLLCVGISQHGVVTSVLGKLRGSASVEVVSSTSKDMNRKSDQCENPSIMVDDDQNETVGKVPGGETPAEETPVTIIDKDQLHAGKPTREKTSHHVDVTLNRIRQFLYLKQEVEPANVDLYEQVFKACAYLTNFQLAS